MHGTNEALTAAAESGDVVQVKFLIEQGIAINSVNAHGQTALQLAAQHGHPSVVSELLRQKADIDVQDDAGGTALSSALRHGHKHIIHILRSATSGENSPAISTSATDRVVTVLGTGQLSAPYVAMTDLNRSVIDVLNDAGVGDAGTIYIPHGAD